jgi:N-acetyl-anhydromuramyl-L-alanine amidase AmpD
MAARTLGLVLAGVLVLAACRDRSPGPGREPTPGSLASALEASGARAGVPRDLLLAVAKTEDGLLVPRQRPFVAPDEAVPAAGPMQLRHGKLDTLRRGAELTGVTETDLRRDGDLALEAGAQVLAEIGHRTGARPDDLGSWNLALEELSGYADDAHRRHYAHRVFATLAQGGAWAARDGETVAMPPHDVPPALALDVSTELRPLATAEYDGAEWIPTSCKNKCDPTRSGFSVEMIVIHDTEGGWDASVATLQNDAGKSVHYIVGTDGKVAQFVTEATTAWHAGNLNYNERSVGIEHVGYDNQPFTEAQYAASAKLVDYLASKYSVVRDRTHVIGHDQVPNGTKMPQASPPCADSPAACEASDDWGGANNHRDPGIWEWATYMPRFGGTAKCNDVGETWSCTADKTKRLRCEGPASGVGGSGGIAIDACSGSCAGGSDPFDSGAGDAVCVGTQATAPTPADSGCAVGRASFATRERGQGGLPWPLVVGIVAGAAARARRRRRRRAPTSG